VHVLVTYCDDRERDNDKKSLSDAPTLATFVKGERVFILPMIQKNVCIRQPYSYGAINIVYYVNTTCCIAIENIFVYWKS
jgi:hypothetical protein